MIFHKTSYEKMTPTEFQQESFKLFYIRRELEHAIMIINSFDGTAMNANSEERKNVIFTEYTMQKTIDIASFESGKKSISISTTPVILKDGTIGLSASLIINNKQIREKDILLELKYLRKNLLIYAAQMRRYYNQMLKSQNWPNLYRR